MSDEKSSEPVDWEGYKNVRKNFDFSINQTLATTLLLREVLKDWPQNLPEPIQRPVVDAMSRISSLWRDYFDEKITSEQMHSEFDRQLKEWDKVEGRKLLFGSVFLMRLSRPDPSKSEIKFDRMVYSQAIVMLFSHLDAFLADSMRAICRGRPDILRSDKKMAWNEIIACGGWGKVMARMVEEYVFNFGWQGVVRRVEFMKKQLGLTFEVSDEDFKVIDQDEHIKNAVTHNGGNASQEYIERSGRTDLLIGQPIPITEELVKQLYTACRSLGEAASEAISKKFFGQDKPFWV